MLSWIVLGAFFLFLWTIVLTASDVKVGFIWLDPLMLLPRCEVYYDWPMKFENTIFEIGWLCFWVDFEWQRKPIIADNSLDAECPWPPLSNDPDIRAQQIADITGKPVTVVTEQVIDEKEKETN